MAGLTLFVFTSLGLSSGHAQGLSYEMDLLLDPGTHRIRGVETIRFTNSTSKATDEVWLHLYLNAFSSSRTTFMRELGDDTLRGLIRPEMSWGWIRIDRVATTAGDDLTAGLEYVQPDDENPHDSTVARLVLPAPLEPAASVELVIVFESQLPRVIARTGFSGDFHMVGQFYPKVGVLTENGWNCHQFHAASEFFANFASYRVKISVPNGWVAGATGYEVERQTDGENDRLVFRADRVHDFAWTTAPADMMTVVEAEFDPAHHVPTGWLETAGSRLGLTAGDLQLPPVQLRLMIPLQQRGLVDRMIRATRLAIAWMGLWYGPYPYPQLTVVSPPPTAEEAWGMEYPTFITTGASRMLTLPVFRRLPWVEMITVHEFGHQYFYGLVASNEFEEAWLDEGMTSYAELSFLDALGREGLTPDLWAVNPWTLERLVLAGSPVPVQPARHAWEYRTLGDYSLASYTRTALVMKTLEGLLGADTLARALREYASRYRFAHPTGQDFETTISEVAGRDLDWFFSQTLRGDASADWAVVEVRQSAKRAARGFEPTADGWTQIEAEPLADDAPWNVEIDLVRRGDLIGPVEVELVFADGRRERRTWQDDARWVTWQLETAEALRRVTVDPDADWILETRRADNYWVDDVAVDETEANLWWVARVVHLLQLLPLPWS